MLKRWNFLKTGFYEGIKVLLTTQQFDPSKYKEGQRQDWDSVAEAWKKWWPFFERNMQQVSTELCDLAEIKLGDRVLDISTGIGEPAVTATVLVGSEGSVYATDQSPAMLRVASERVSELRLNNIELAEADAEALELPEAEFDAAVCRWGLMFLPNPHEALRRIHSSLKPGAKFATSVWSTPDKVPFISLPMGIAQKGGYVNRCVNDIRRRPSQPLIQWRFHPHTVHRDRRLRSTQGPSDA